MKKIILVLLMSLGLYSCQSEKAADIIYYNAKIITMSAESPEASFIAIKGKGILAVGTKSFKQYQNSKTKLIDLKGKVILPGLTESHGHLISSGLALSKLNLTGKSKNEILDLIKNEAKKKRVGEWIVGRGWDQNLWNKKVFPSADDLEKVSPNNPVYLSRIDGHASWVNRTALKLAGITNATKSPDGGKILKDQKSPTGILIDKAMGLVSKKIEDTSLETLKDAAILGQEMAFSLGITSFHEVSLETKRFMALKDLAENNKIKLKLHAMIKSSESLLVGDLLDEGIKKFGDRFEVRGFKIYGDGALGSRGAALFKDYNDDPGNKGLVLTPKEEVKELTIKAIKAGLQVTTHAIGDRTNHVVLNAYEEAMKITKVQDPRLRIEHAQHLAKADIPRFGKLGVIASMQPTHCTSDSPWVEDRIGKERQLEGAYVWQKLLNSGAKIIAGSDTPIESMNPFWGIYSFLTRQDHQGQPPKGWQPKQRLNIMQALRAYTIDAAYATFSENQTGSLEAGKLADMIVIDRDIRKIKPKEILNTKVLLTVVEGEVVYSEI